MYIYICSSGFLSSFYIFIGTYIWVDVCVYIKYILDMKKVHRPSAKNSARLSPRYDENDDEYE